MGSTGSGSFTDYSGSQNPKENGGSGGSSGTDRCSQAFSCTLQEVAQCDYLKKHGAPPPVQSQLSLIVKGRIFAVDASGTTVGALPTSHNYLAACLKSGFEYVGLVTASKSSPLPSVTADFKAK
jgi:hypothetical protein